MSSMSKTLSYTLSMKSEILDKKMNKTIHFG